MVCKTDRYCRSDLDRRDKSCYTFNKIIHAILNSTYHAFKQKCYLLSCEDNFGINDMKFAVQNIVKMYKRRAAD